MTKQKDYLDKLVAAYPNDERAQFNLGNYYFGQQDYGPAIEHYKKATELAPNYSPAYNILGYAYRQQDDYANAEQAFKKYVELIPNDPNPYDSYARAAAEDGQVRRFDRRNIARRCPIDPHFVPSHFGISADLTYMGKPQEAEAELQRWRSRRAMTANSGLHSSAWRSSPPTAASSTRRCSRWTKNMPSRKRKTT